MFKSLLLILLISVVLPSQAFNAQAHTLICALAYDELSPEAREQVDHLVKISELGKSFSSLCSWPDQIRKTSEFEHTSQWHYMNVPRSASHVSKDDCPTDGCVLSAIETMMTRLSEAPHRDWQALLFLGHFVADIHQPLHVSYADDRGGNDTLVYFNGKRTNLHSLWDNKVLGLSEADDLRVMAIYKDRLINSESAQIPPMLDPSQWATESLLKTKIIYRDYKRGEKLTDESLSDHRIWLQQRVLLASFRLADLLENIFAESRLES